MIKLNNIKPETLIIILQGGSGSGKTLLAKMLHERLGIPKAITCTTREPKQGEQEGIDYYFINIADFHEEDFLEYARYAGNLYGTKADVLENPLKEHKVITVILEEDGARKFKSAYPDNTLLVSLPISIVTMEENLMKREDPSMHTRLETAHVRNESKPLDIADLVLTENDLEDKFNKLKEVIGGF